MRKQKEDDAARLQQKVPDPDDGVSYATVNYIRKQKAAGVQVPVRGDDGGDEGDTVTYSTVKVSSSSTHPSDVYATVNKPQK
ncbi:hypothetical protein INR49_008773 [Caranx melampygus]|nr:hypothetical protein INR49_008773 [Caranx melampygus]